MKSDFENRRKARIEAYRHLAQKRKEEANLFFERAHQISDGIPLGQPILVDHYSAKHHRKDIQKIQNLTIKSIESSKSAEYYEEKAKAAESNKAIFSDDPEVIKKLKAELAELEALQEKMKKANKLIKKNDRKGLADLGFSEKIIDELFTPDFCNRVGFARFTLTANNASIRRLKKRIQEEEIKQTQTTTETVIGDIKIVDSVEDNRIQIFFPGKPDEHIRKQLKTNGFRWAPSIQAWQRHRHADNRYIMQKITEILKG